MVWYGMILMSLYWLRSSFISHTSIEGDTAFYFSSCKRESEVYH
jgi:hypothetical protein